MTWFKVDDSFHSHPKVYAASPAALGLWVVAGSWSGANLSDGFVPDHALPRLLPDSVTLAQELVAVGLWKRTKGGYRFHDWGDFNPLGSDIQKERSAAKERMRRLRAGRKSGDRDIPVTSPISESDRRIAGARPVDNKQSTPSNAGQSANGSGEQGANVRQLFVTPTRPDPYLGGALGDPPTPGAREAQPPSKCQDHEHLGDPPPCGRCADARRSRTRWEMTEAERIRKAPKCRRHRGQLAGNCALCRSEALADQEAQ